MQYSVFLQTFYLDPGQDLLELVKTLAEIGGKDLVLKPTDHVSMLRCWFMYVCK